MKEGPKNKDYDEDFRFVIERANEIVRLYENRRKIFLEINLALVAAFSAISTIFYGVFGESGKNAVSIAVIIYYFITICNICYNLGEHKTNCIQSSIVSFRDYDRKVFDEKNFTYKFKDDYIKQINNLHKYQKNYHKIAKQTRCFTFLGVISLLILLIEAIIIERIKIEIELSTIAVVMITVLVITVLILGFIVGIIKNKKRIKDFLKGIFCIRNISQRD